MIVYSAVSKWTILNMSDCYRAPWCIVWLSSMAGLDSRGTCWDESNLAFEYGSQRLWTVYRTNDNRKEAKMQYGQGKQEV